MRKIVSSAMALLLLFAFSGGTALAQDETSVHALHEQNNSGQSGTVTFRPGADGTSVVVEINISGGSAVPQPAHIHTGSCEDLDPRPFFPLNSVVDGRSVTVITEAEIDRLDYELYNLFSVNVHKSAAEASVYVACGELVPGGNVSAPGMPRTGGNNLAPLLALLALALVGAGAVLSPARRAA